MEKSDYEKSHIQDKFIVEYLHIYNNKAMTLGNRVKLAG